MDDRKREVLNGGHYGAAYPFRKISETLLTFASPIFEEMDRDPTEKEVQDVLTICVTVWNGVVLSVLGDDVDYLGQMRRQLAGSSSEGAAGLFDMLVCRKHERFAADLRLIGAFEAFRTPEGRYSVRAEARMHDVLLEVPAQSS